MKVTAKTNNKHLSAVNRMAILEVILPVEKSMLYLFDFDFVFDY
jgi:hypothetical protein|tara:strand:- start:1538 stop:1669 length:132 start_codon:yes stop_codon:yes gene_type:complete